MKGKVKTLLTKDWMIRAMKTFVQASVGAVAILVPTQDWTAVKSALVAVLIGAVSAGGAAVWNLLMAHFGVTTGTVVPEALESHQNEEIK